MNKTRKLLLGLWKFVLHLQFYFTCIFSIILSVYCCDNIDIWDFIFKYEVCLLTLSFALKYFGLEYIEKIEKDK